MRPYIGVFFSVQVAKPLDVKTKFLNIEDDILLEVQIQNITPSPMFLEVVSFDPNASFSALDLNTLRQDVAAGQEEELVGRGQGCRKGGGGVPRLPLPCRIPVNQCLPLLMGQ